ncbi:hypothetical protein NDA16_003421 [Ustilago loliicola]|nr:hypothetical protein NDA16_003421 [Ustilago loliicola]
MENIVHVRKQQDDGDVKKRDGHMLCLNAGSSSLKLKLFDLSASSSDEQEPEALIRGSIKLKHNSAEIELTHSNGQSHTDTKAWTDIASSEILSYLLSTLSDLVGSGNSLNIRTVVHRVTDEEGEMARQVLVASKQEQEQEQ